MACEVPPLGTPQLDPFCNLQLVVDDVITDQLAEWSEGIKTWIGEAAATMVEAATTAWLGVVTPGVTVGDPALGVRANTVAFLQDSMMYFSVVILIFTLIAASAHMAWTHRAEPMKEFLIGLVRFVFLAGAGAALVGILLNISEAYSQWIIDRATAGGGFAATLGKLILNTGGLGFILIVIFSVLGLIVTGLQVALLWMRGAAVVVLTGSLLLAASSATTQTGKAWFAKLTGWLLAWILYKPAAATMYAAAFKLIGDSDSAYDDTKTVEHIAGFALLFLAIIALPAMIRLVQPLTEAVASGRGFGSAALGAAAVALPTGAIAAKAAAGAASSAGSSAGNSGSGNSSTPPPSGPTGAAPAPTGGSTAGTWKPAPSTP